MLVMLKSNSEVKRMRTIGGKLESFMIFFNFRYFAYK